MEALPPVLGQASPGRRAPSPPCQWPFPQHCDALCSLPSLVGGVEINSTGTSVVWRVRADGAEAALKEVTKASLFTPVLRDNATREVAALRALRHKHVVGFLGAFQTNSLLFLLMEYHPRDLYRYTTSTLIVAPRTATRWVHELASALRHLKRNGWLHRDIKLENVLVTAGGSVKLTDFGLAIPQVRAAGVSAAGTRHCVSPEVKAGHVPGYEIDAWGLGVLLFELLSGAVPPFSYGQIGSPKDSGQQPFNTELLRSSSPRCLALLRGLLQRVPSERLRVEAIGKSRACTIC